MRLYSRGGATVVDDPEFGHFEPNDDGSFDFPDDLSDRLRRFHVSGQPLWEDDIERQNRIASEEMKRAQDPATLLATVQQLVQALGVVAPAAQAVQAQQAPAVAKRTSKRAAAAPAAE